MLSNFERVLDRLKVVSRNGNKAQAFCPAHNDRNKPSLSVKAEYDRVLLHCFVGCKFEEIVAAMNLERSDLFESRDGQGRGGSFIPQVRLKR